MNIAYLSQGKLFVKEHGTDPRAIESHFGQEVINRAIRMRQKNEWKTQRKETPFSGSMLWGVEETDSQAIRVHITAAAQGSEPGKLFFILDTDATGGLFLSDWRANTERRVFHKEQFRARYLDWHPTRQMLACSQYFDNGTANIVIMNAEGQEMRQLTEGDSLDEAPSWVPGSDYRLVFQSAGLARNQQGYFMGTGPFAVHCLDLERKTLDILLDDQRYDFLLPHMNANGELYVIRRPYEMPGHAPYSVLQAMLDFLMFPFRLLRAIFHFLNFFSLTFSQKPLTTASGPQITGDDEHTLMLRGRIIQAQKTMREAAKNQESPSLVPDSWELVRRTSSGEERVLASGVVSFDLAPDNTLIYTNGSAVYQMDSAGKSKQILKGSLIEHVMLLN